MKLYACDLRDDSEAIAAYEQWHLPGHVFPEVIAGLRGEGIGQMRIFRTGNRLVIVLADDDGNLFGHEPGAREMEWQAVMGNLLQAIPWAVNGATWVELKQVFDLRQHP
jgi:L-rhamnose mutarotase